MVSHKEMNFEQLVEGKSVAVVGNASSLFDQKHGSEIDSHDIVIRFNKAAPVLIKDCEETHGSKFDVWAFWAIGAFYRSITETEEDMREMLNYFHEKRGIKRVQLSKSRNRVDITREYGFDTLPTHYMKELKRRLVYSKAQLGRERLRRQHNALQSRNIKTNFIQPSAGTGMLFWLKLCRPRKVTIYGMDFKKSPTFSEPHLFERDMISRIDVRCAHNFEMEEEFVKREILTDKRFTLK
jgi:hypothetical protein